LEIQPGALLRHETAEIVNHLSQTAVTVSIVDVQGRRESILAGNPIGQFGDLPHRLAG
jgi:hypothetical protein